MKTIAASELRRAPYILLAIFVLLAAGIITAGCLYYQHYKENYRVEVERRLSAIAELKVNELVRWRNERLSDAGIFYGNAAFSALVQHFFETPDDVEAQRQIRTWLSRVRAAYEYDRIILLDAQGIERVSVPDTSESGAPHPAGDIAEVLRSREVTFLDFHRHAPDCPICLGVLVPILDGHDENRAIGILTLRINPETYLYPFINQWPIPSRTAETLIIRREGNEAVFLNELKFQKNTALNLRVPLENKELPAVKAALGQEGIVQGIDYSGMPVIAAVRAVPDSPWFLVARLDISEVYAPIKEKLWVIIVFVGVLLMAAATGVGFIWKQQSARFYRQKCEAAEALRESEERYRIQFEQTIDALFLADTQTGIILECNRAAMELVGREKSEMVGQHQRILHPSEEWDGKFSKSFKQHIIGGTLVEAKVIKKSGEIRDVAIKASTFDLKGKKVILAIFRDITERKKAEETHSHLLTMLETTPDFVGFADPKNAGILYMNSAGRRMVGVGADEDVTMLKINDVHPEWTNQLLRDEIIPTAIRDGVWKGECAFLNRDGREIPVMMVLMAHKSASGEVLRISTISRDITERKQMEEDLRSAKAQAESANEAKSEFLANMSHEIRTPLNAIIGFSEILACEDLSDEQAEWIKTIRDSGEHLLELINDILDFSRIEAGKLDLEMIEYSLENLCAKVESLMRPAAMKKGLEFGFRENGVLPARIRTDPTRLSQCLLNLVGNAVKFTEQGHVYINVRPEMVDDEPYIRFDVEDTGIGIPPEKQQLIFESFTQADGSTTRRFGGSGLGLAITKRLAELLGGQVSLTSEEGKGSVFSLVVPVGAGLSEQAPSGGRELSDGSSAEQSPPRRTAPDAEFKFTGRALVAEDAVTNQMLIKVMLERMGLEVTMVKDGAEAVREGLAQSYDLIFMDIQMPNMSGYEAARRLRKKGLTTPIIALTANAMEGDDKKCIEAGCDDYLPKPIGRAKLMEMTRKYLTPQSQDLSEKIDSVESTVDDLGRLCSQDVAPQADSADTDSAGGVIDWAQLISRVVEEGIARKIVPLCVEDNRERLEMLAAAVQAGNAKDVKLYAHAIKGSAANTGATRLSQVAYRLEYMAYRDDLSQAEQLLQEIRSEFGRFESFVSQPDWVETAKKQEADNRLDTADDPHR